MSGNSDQIAEWNGPLGERWAELQSRLDELTGPFGRAALKAAAARPGERIIDIGCGCGETTFALAQAAGPAGAVTGVDISRPMLDSARRQAASGPRNIAFLEADASAADLPRDNDLLFSRFGVMFFDEPVPAFTHLHSALKSTGRMAFCCWRTAQENPWATTPMAATRAALDVTDPPPHPHAPGPFAFADPDRLRGILNEAGFTDIAIQPFDAPVRLGSSPRDAAENAVRFGPAGRLVREKGEASLPAALAAIEAAVASLAGPDGTVFAAGAVWIVTATA
jgi:SAM-dependent methyltransferase